METPIVVKEGDLYIELRRTVRGTERDLPLILVSPEVDFAVNNDGSLSEKALIGIRLGIPLDENDFILIPSEPTVMFVDRLFVRDKNHPDWVDLRNVPLLLCHGVWSFDREQWEFSDGQVVKEVVAVWQKHARESGLPRVEFVASCNTQLESSYQPREDWRTFLKSLVDKKFAEKTTRNKIVLPNIGGPEAVGESYGKVVWFTGEVTDGQVVMSLEVKDGEFAGLDDLAVWKDVTIRD